MFLPFEKKRCADQERHVSYFVNNYLTSDATFRSAAECRSVP